MEHYYTKTIVIYDIDEYSYTFYHPSFCSDGKDKCGGDGSQWSRLRGVWCMNATAHVRKDST